MLALVLIVVAQGPGSNLEVKGAQTSLPINQASSDLRTRPLEGRPGSEIHVSRPTELARKVTLVESKTQACEGLATQFVCDDPSVMKGELVNEPLVLSETIPPIVPHIRFTALSPGRTLCSCGQPRNLQLLYEFTVGSLEDAVRPVARKVVGAAYARLYTQNP